MITNRVKWFGVIFLSFCLLFNITVIPSCAIAVPDPDRVGSIAVTMQDPETGRAVSGGTITLLKAGNLHGSDGNFSFVFTDRFKSSGESLEELDSDLAQRLADYAGKHKIDGDTFTIGSDGRADFNGLSPGLYLIIQEQASQGYYDVAPFFVSIPMMENGRYVYNVDATPKMELLSKNSDASQLSSYQSAKAKTGDGSHMMLWSSVMSAELVIGIIIMIATGKQQKNRN